MKVGDVFMDHDEILMNILGIYWSLPVMAKHMCKWHFLDAQLRAIAPMCDADIVLDAIQLHSWIVG